MEQPNDLIIVEQARRLLGVGPAKMSKLIKEGVIRTYHNPLDARTKLVSKSAVISLIPKRAEAA
jgi:DNA-binding MarR family transcriptional regulator